MRKNSKSLRKSSPSKLNKKKDCQKRCEKKKITPLNIQNSLSRKYSNTQNFHYITCVNQICKDDLFAQQIKETLTEECLQRYYKSLNRKHIFSRIKEVYKLHTQIPRIFQPQMKQILNKCYHRKRLLEYFKIAKVLGIKVQGVKFSSFLLSINDITNRRVQNNKKFDPIITKISTIDFSTQAQRNILEEFFFQDEQLVLSNKENSISKSNNGSLFESNRKVKDPFLNKQTQLYQTRFN